MANRITGALKTAALVSGGVAVLVAITLVFHWRQIAADGGVAWYVVLIGLPSVVFLSYFILGIAGYRVRPDGFVSAPRAVAWAVVSVAATALVVVMLILAFGRK